MWETVGAVGLIGISLFAVYRLVVRPALQKRGH